MAKQAVCRRLEWAQMRTSVRQALLVRGRSASLGSLVIEVGGVVRCYGYVEEHRSHLVPSWVSRW